MFTRYKKIGSGTRFFLKCNFLLYHCIIFHLLIGIYVLLHGVAWVFCSIVRLYTVFFHFVSIDLLSDLYFSFNSYFSLMYTV